MIELGQDSQRAKDWQKVIEQELRTGNVDGVDFRHFFDGFTAATDAPSCVRSFSSQLLHLPSLIEMRRTTLRKSPSSTPIARSSLRTETLMPGGIAGRSHV